MAYIRKIVGHDEKIIGIARLHWIYVITGLFWFLALAGGGWLLELLLTKIGLSVAGATGSVALSALLLQAGDGISVFLMGGGILMFVLYVIKVLTTEIGLTNRRVMHKRGLLFVKVNQIDLEEIRGENLDTGTWGRLLNYGYLLLDCRFIGDVRLPAIENAEGFLRVLHDVRAKTQDSLALVVGKGNPRPIAIDPDAQQQPEVPQPAPPQPTPEIQPGQPGPHPEVDPGNVPSRPEIPAMPVPHAPPPAPPQQPPAPPVQPPAQPIPAPPPSEPPLQPPSESAAPAVVNADIVRQVVQQAMPQMAQQVAQELVKQGVIDDPANDGSKDVDTGLIESFDEAALDKNGHPRDLHNKLEHAIH